jgi:hypothetical protein
MTVTINKKITLQEHENEAQKEKDLFWVRSIRQFIPPIGKLTKWKNLSPEACKLYLLIWALDSAKWSPNKKNPYQGAIHHSGLLKYSGLDETTIISLLQQLVKQNLITAVIVYDVPNNIWIKLVYNLPPDVIENGV